MARDSGVGHAYLRYGDFTGQLRLSLLVPGTNPRFSLRRDTFRSMLPSRMARKSAPVKNTGGGGHDFDDEVAAGLLVAVLSRGFPLGADEGYPVQLDWQVKESGWHLDDLLLRIKQPQAEIACAISAKSNVQLNTNGFSDSFVQDVWDQWRGESTNPFNHAHDYLCIAVPRLAQKVEVAWEGIRNLAGKMPPDRLAARLTTPDGSNREQRAIFTSIVHASRPPSEKAPELSEAAALLSRIRVIHWNATAKENAIRRCAELTASNSAEDGRRLWKRLFDVARENRTSGGSVNVKALIDKLKSEFDLHDYPDYKASWRTVEEISEENRSSVRNAVGSGIQFDFASQEKTLREKAEASAVVVVLAESGMGKSALISRFATSEKSLRRWVWFKPSQLSKSSHREVADHLHLKHTLLTLIENSPKSPGVLVLDGIERFDGEALDRAVELLRSAILEGTNNWRVIVTCQTLRWEEIRKRLLEAGARSIDQFPMEGPGFGEIYETIKHVRGMPPVLMRQELRPVLSNLATLDQVLQAGAVRPMPDFRPWIGETEVIDWIWEYWTGSDAKRFARADLLRSLGEKEGERVSGAVNLEDVPSRHLELLGELTAKGLIRADLESVQFKHDIMGDWARYFALRASGDAVSQNIKRRAKTPRWERAIRLYAQSLAEQDLALEQWNSVLGAVQGVGADSQLASDLFSDSLILATNSRYLLEQLWPSLLNDKGKLLHRALVRMLVVATVPNPAIDQIEDASLREYARAELSVPHPLYWISVLRVLNNHRDEVVRAVPGEAAHLCLKYLSILPTGVPGREDAAALSVALAREVQGQIAEGVIFIEEADRPVYEALLHAAQELPDEVSQIALELCNRRPEPEHAAIRRTNAEEEHRKSQEAYAKRHPEQVQRRKSHGFFGGSGRALPPPWPDGPSDRVSDSFISAVMNTQALTPLIKARPDVAREVLLAVCIEEPTSRESNDFLSRAMDYGLSYWSSGYPPIYFRGPFMAFLDSSSDSAIDTIIHLTNFTTQRWLENRLGPNPDRAAVRHLSWELMVDGRAVRWLGDPQVFNWHRFVPLHGAAVECALMALEKWLYDAIGVGKDIQPMVKRIYAEGRSVSFAGVLTAVGLRHPSLFCDLLQPLLGILSLYEVQLLAAGQEAQPDWQTSMMQPWADKGKAAYERALEWNQMPHRRRILHDVVQWLMFQDAGTMEYMTRCRLRWKEKWARELDDPNIDTTRLEFLLARFDSANYTKTELPDGTTQIEQTVPQELQKKSEASMERVNLERIVLYLLQASRKVLSGALHFADAQLPALVSTLHQIQDSKIESESIELYRSRALAGGLAVLLSCHREWLRQNPEDEAWCLQTLRVLKGTPEADSYPESWGDTWEEAYRAEAALALLCEGEEEWVRRAVFDGITGFYYESTLLVMRAAYKRRAELGTRFDELVNLVIAWSAIRNGANHEQRARNGEVLKPYRDALLRRYQSGRLHGSPISIERVQLFGRRLAERVARRSPYREMRRLMGGGKRRPDERADRKLHRQAPHLDLTVLQKGFGFLAELESAPAQDRYHLYGFFRELFELEMRSLPGTDGSNDWEIDEIPCEFDRWIMQFTAAFVAKSESPKSARMLYAPILDLSCHAHYWVRDFLHAWFQFGLVLSGSEKAFAARWAEIVEYALSSPAWNRENCRLWFYLDDLANELMGITGEHALRVEGAEFKQAILEMAPMFERWCDTWLKSSRVTKHFAYFLSTDSGHVLLSMGIKKIAEAVRNFSRYDWDERDLNFALVKGLIACWDHNRAEVVRGGDVAAEFHGLLNELCARLIPEALQLRNRVAGE